MTRVDDAWIETAEALAAIVRGQGTYIGVSKFPGLSIGGLSAAQYAEVSVSFVYGAARTNCSGRSSGMLPLVKGENLAADPVQPDAAGGLLRGKISLDEKPETGRFSAEVRTVRRRVSGPLTGQSARVRDDRQACVNRRRRGEAAPKLAVAGSWANRLLRSVILVARRTGAMDRHGLAAADYNLPPELKTKWTTYCSSIVEATQRR